MSRAFLRDDAEGEMPRRNYHLPERDDPEYDRVAARALLEAARVGSGCAPVPRSASRRWSARRRSFGACWS
jgi:hypothetical protein